MLDVNLQSDWNKHSKLFLESADAAGLPPVSLKVLKSEFISISEAMKDFNDAQKKKKLADAMKNVKALGTALSKVDTLIEKETKKSTDKQLVEATKKIKVTLRKLEQSHKETFKETLVQQSHDEALAENKIDWKATISSDLVDKIAKVTLDLGEYKKFSSSFGSFVSKYDLGSESKKLPVVIWAELIKGLAKSGYIDGKIKHVQGDPKQYILAEMQSGPNGKLIRDELLSQAMDGLKPFLNHADRYLSAVIKKLGQGSTWAFWSGVGAKEAAKKDGGGGVVLEGTIGSWFDEVWDFEKLTGGTKSLALWASMSELYAKKAAEHYERFSFVGFVGPGSMRDQSVFNKIEQPTFIEVFDTKIRKATPEIVWWVTDCEMKDGRWVWTGNKSQKIGTSRSAALKEIKERYGG